MQLTMPSEPATAVSTAIKTLSNFAQLKFCAILFSVLGFNIGASLVGALFRVKVKGLFTAPHSTFYAITSELMRLRVISRLSSRLSTASGRKTMRLPLM